MSSHADHTAALAHAGIAHRGNNEYGQSKDWADLLKDGLIEEDGQFIGKRPREAGPPLTSYLALMDLYLVQIAP